MQCGYLKAVLTHHGPSFGEAMPIVKIYEYLEIASRDFSVKVLSSGLRTIEFATLITLGALTVTYINASSE